MKKLSEGMIEELIGEAVDAEFGLAGIVEFLNARALRYRDPHDQDSEWSNPDEGAWGKGWRLALIQLSATLDRIEHETGERFLARWRTHDLKPTQGVNKKWHE